MSEFDWMLYSRGTYWLFEHFDDRTLYHKSKYTYQEDFLKGAGKMLTKDQVLALTDGLSITIPQEYGTIFFFKYVSM